MTKPFTRLGRRSLLAAMLWATALSAPAQTAAGFPYKPIKSLVPFTAGSGADTSSRYYGEALGKLLG